MPKFLHNALAELTHQLNLSPKRLRLEQLAGIERLLALVEAERSYPYDLVCYHITGYQKRGTPSTASIPGKALLADLVTMAECISRRANIPVGNLPEASRTHEELAKDLNVSTKTIRRWRGRGLMGIRVLDEQGVSRMAFLSSSVDRFVARNKALVAKGAAFRQLSEPERDSIINRAREILARKPYKLHVVARMIAEETNRAVETVRYTLRRHDRQAGSAALFGANGSSALSERHQAIWTMHQAGEPVEAIARASSCSVEVVGRVLREVRIRRWRETPIEFIHNELFDAPNADDLILAAAEPAAPEQAAGPRPPRDLPAYLQSLYLVPLLSAEQERDLFRRYNYLKYRAARALGALDPARATDAQLAEVSSLLDRSEAIKNRIIQANLRLVVSIAKKHVGWSAVFFDVVSDGNMSLMRAIEKFDFARGNRFSTYATWAIVKNYARTIPEDHYHYHRFVTGQEEILSAAPDESTAPEFSTDRQQVRKAIAAGLDQLDAREREIVSAHFGLAGQGDGLTLEELGRRFGVTKERIRQIERRALARLREVLSPSLADAVV